MFNNIDLYLLWLVRLAALALLVGIVWRASLWLRRPSRQRVVLTPAPRSHAGVIFMMLHESLIFTTLFKASRSTWLFGWSFHVGLALILLQHLRYLTHAWWPWVNWLASMGHIASAIMLFGLFGLIARRLLVDRVRYISRPSDHLILLLIAALALSGILLKYMWPMNVVHAKDFLRSALFLQEFAIHPGTAGFWLHVLLASILLAIFPFGKLMHGPALWFNPTRAQIDRPRV